MAIHFPPLETGLLKLLREESESFFPIRVLSEMLRQPVAAVKTALQQLADREYLIERDEEGAVRLAGIPDRLFPVEIRTGLDTGRFGHQVESFWAVDSTNTKAAELAQAGAVEGTLVVAESQLAGKGRLKRSWYSPECSGIYASLILRPNIAPETAPGISLLLAVSIAEVCREYLQVDALIKWPNDVLVAGRKVAGILADLDAESARVRHLVLGFGINVNQRKGEFPPDIAERATSLRIAAGKTVDRVRLLRQILQNLENRYDRFLVSGLSQQLPDIKALSVVLGKQIRFEQRQQHLTGRAVDINSNGLLVVDLDGKLLTLAAGEVSLMENY